MTVNLSTKPRRSSQRREEKSFLETLPQARGRAFPSWFGMKNGTRDRDYSWKEKTELINSQPTKILNPSGKELLPCIGRKSNRRKEREGACLPRRGTAAQNTSMGDQDFVRGNSK